MVGNNLVLEEVDSWNAGEASWNGAGELGSWVALSAERIKITMGRRSHSIGQLQLPPFFEREREAHRKGTNVWSLCHTA